MSTSSAAPMHVGWLGLGAMGGRLAGKFLDQGHPVSGWNRTPGRATELVKRGMEELATPEEVVGTCDVVFSMVTNSAAVEAIIGGEHGLLAGMRPGVVVVEMSTIDPGVSRRLAHEVETAGGRMLDCPVSGGVPAAEAGELSVMVGATLMPLTVFGPCSTSSRGRSPTSAETDKDSSPSSRSTSHCASR